MATVEVSPTSDIPCHICSIPILIKSLRVVFTRSNGDFFYYHLSCYRPEGNIQLTFDQFTLRHGTRSAVRQLKQRISEWNSQCPLQVLPSTTTKVYFRRELLTVFEFLSIEELEQVVAFVCKRWNCLCTDEEFWKSKYALEIAPMVEKFKAVKKVQNSTMQLLAIPKFEKCKAKSKYMERIAEIMSNYANKRREKLIEALFCSYLPRIRMHERVEIELIDISKIYKGMKNQFYDANYILKAAMIYFGKPNSEGIDRHIEEFIEDIETNRLL